MTKKQIYRKKEKVHAELRKLEAAVRRKYKQLGRLDDKLAKIFREENSAK